MNTIKLCALLLLAKLMFPQTVNPPSGGGGGGGSGTVTSVSFTGGVISVGTPTTTPALTVQGTSGGIPYFDSTSSWNSSAALAAGQFVLGGGAGATPTTSFSIVTVAKGGTGLASGTSGGILGYTASGTLASSGALTANRPVIGGGAGAVPTVGTVTGNTTLFATFTGATTNGDCVSIDGSGNLIAAGGPCTTGGGGGTVNAGTATHLAYYASSTNAVSDMGADFTFASNTLTMGASGLLNLSAGGATALTIPTGAGLAPTADGQIAYNTSTDRFGVGNSGTNNPLVVAASTDTFTNKTYDAEGTGNLLTIPFQVPYKAAVCQNTTASLGFSTPTSNPAVATCVTGTNTQYATADFADGANTLSVQDHFPLPTGFTGNVDLDITWRTSATSGDVVWQAATICVADAETGDPAFNTASTVTDTAKGTTLQFNTATISAVTITGCAANEELFFRFFRDPANGSDTLAATASLISLRWTIRRAM